MSLPQIRSGVLGYIYDSCDLSPTVCADGEKLQRILMNLSSTSSKFTEERGTVTVLCDVQGRSVCNSVREPGVGIAAEKLQRVVERFVQIECKRRQPAIGAGLGVAISRDLARSMSGDLPAEVSKAGSTFTLAIPCLQNHPI